MKKRSGYRFLFPGSGSGEGIKALIDKTTDIATSSREIKKEEVESLEDKNVNPVASGGEMTIFPL